MDEQIDDDSKKKSERQTAFPGHVDEIVMLPCPFCDGAAKTYCKIETYPLFRGHKPESSKQHVSVMCRRCGYHISALTADRMIIRKLWNVRAA